jgi:tetratricopeptide (TPR) repeat protein
MNTTQFSLVILFCLIVHGQVPAAQHKKPGDGDTVTTDTPVAPEASRSVEMYREQINEQESQQGAYDPQLSEQLLGLGLLYKTQGQYDEAAKALEQALHIKRVNEGVDNMAQVPVLSALIDVNTTAGNWEELDRNYELLVQVNQRNLASDEPLVLADIERAGRWKLLAYNKNLLKKKPDRILSNLIEMYEATVKIIEELHGKDDPRLIGPLNNLSLARYHMLEEINSRSLGEFQGTGEKERLQRVCRPVFTRQGWITVCNPEMVSNPDYYFSRQTSKNASLHGQQNNIVGSLNRIIKIIGTNPALTPHELAIALVNTGDWYFLYNMKDAAIANYKRAFQLLMEDGPGADGIDQVFGRPIRIPSIAAFPDIDDDFARETGDPYVRLSFDVGTDGKPGNIEVVEEGNTKNFIPRKTAKAQVASWLFRPQLEGGEPVVTKGMEIQLSGALLRRKPPQSGPVGVTGSRIRR